MRNASCKRVTGETDISMELNLDGTGAPPSATGHAFFDHMLDLLARHSLMDLTLQARGDLEVDAHHTVEDVGIVLGECIKNALGDKKGIARYGCSYLPMDETLTRVVMDLSNRPYVVFRIPEGGLPDAPNFPLTLCEEFCRALANNLRCNLHVEVLYGRDGHHIAESVFKGIAMRCGRPRPLTRVPPGRCLQPRECCKSMKLGVIDYGAGNLRSVLNTFEAARRDWPSGPHAGGCGRRDPSGSSRCGRLRRLRGKAAQPGAGAADPDVDRAGQAFSGHLRGLPGSL